MDFAMIWLANRCVPRGSYDRSGSTCSPACAGYPWRRCRSGCAISPGRPMPDWRYQRLVFLLGIRAFNALMAILRLMLNRPA